MANQSRAVLYLERDKFQLSIDTRADVLSYVFPPNLVNNLDILDSDALKQNLSEFIKKNSIVMTSLVIVLSAAVIFEQDFKTEDEAKIQEFLDNVPYETISIKKIPIPGGTKIFIGNATFYTLLADVFKQNGVKLDYVIPERALGANIGAFNASTARLILTQFEALSQYKFIVDESTENKIEYKPPEKKVIIHKKNYTLYYSIPVFALLILVLAFMLLQPILFKEKTTNKVLAAGIPTLAPAYIPPTTQPPVTAPSTAQLKKPTTAQITADPTATAKVDQIKAQLVSLGISNIQVSTAPSDISVPVVSISIAVDPTEKQKVLDAVKKIFPSVSSQDSVDTAVDVYIIIGKTQ